MTPERLRMLRKRIGLTQAELAQMMNYSRVYYSQIECGMRPMPEGFYQRAIQKMIKHLKMHASLYANELKTATCQEGKGYYGT